MKQSIIIPAIFLAVFSLFTLNLDAQTPSFKDFLKQFPTASLPYSFNAQDLQTQIESRPIAKAKRLSYDFYQFLPELERSAQFSSMPVFPEPIASFETKEYYAVLYNIARGLSRGTKTYSISVFDKQGNYIGTHFVAGVNPSTLTIAKIDDQLNASVKEYKLNWANDFGAFGADGNKVTGLTLRDMQTIDLATEGNPDQLEWTSRAQVMQNNSADIAKMK
jgi:hypothetical protein